MMMQVTEDKTVLREKAPFFLFLFFFGYGRRHLVFSIWSFVQMNKILGEVSFSKLP